MSDILGRVRESIRIGRPVKDVASRLGKDIASHAVDRFLASWSTVDDLGADQAVLLRQALRWSGITELLLELPESLHGFTRALLKAGVERSPGRIRVVPFKPAWLPDASSCDDPPVMRALYETLPAEAYLQSVGYSHWRSQAQKEAVWAVLNAQPGTTNLVVLPTGAGKSLCFQLLPRFFSGLTVVVVPTIALAMDQHESAASLLRDLPGVNPRFFAADQDADNTVQQLKDLKSRLIFTSPEACVSGRLRTVLDEFARTGWLHNLVVDEAHLVETWGANFRVEFQVLAALRQKWLKASDGRLTTFLFSATMTSECRRLLRQLFSEQDKAREFVCQRLRPEIRYYARSFDDPAQRQAAVTEALWRLPRPAILYVTERTEADQFFQHFRGEGFRRIACVHGDTPNETRRDTLNKWKSNALDLIVATSAFGVGVDKPDVRVVVHACFPENLDRYYQEVGRGGRDGYSSISLLLPTPRDRRVAESITVQLMTPAMIQKRWSAMFNKAELCDDDYTYAVPMNSRRTGLVGTPTYAENVRWNKRLLLQLHRAGKLELRDLELRDPETQNDEREEWAIVRVKFPPTTPSLADLIRDQRDDELQRFRQGANQLGEFLSTERCAARLIASLYNIQSHQRGCPGCPWCRERDRQPLQCNSLDFPPAEVPTQTRPSELIEDCPSPVSPSGRPEFVNVVHGLVTRKHLRQFYCGESFFSLVLSCFNDAFPVNDLALYRIDPVTEQTRLSLSATPPVVFFHIGHLDQRAFNLGRHFGSVHLLCGVHNANDHNGRHVSTNEALRLWSSMDAWFALAAEESLG